MIRVIRVGGSLLAWGELPSRLLQFLADQSPAVTVLLAGGGPWVELVRDSVKQFQLTEEDAHWLAIRGMGLTAQLLSRITGLPTTANLSETGHNRASTYVLDAEAFLREEELRVPGTPLPHSWRATSDSIAARIAQALRANELILLKSCDCSGIDDLGALAEAGIVDDFFPTAARDLASVQFVNLRSWSPRSSLPAPPAER